VKEARQLLTSIQRQMKEIQDKQVNEKLETERKMNRLEELKQHYNLKRINQ
jgi:hypothetical protein